LVPHEYRETARTAVSCNLATNKYLQKISTAQYRKYRDVFITIARTRAHARARKTEQTMASVAVLAVLAVPQPADRAVSTSVPTDWQIGPIHLSPKRRTHPCPSNVSAGFGYATARPAKADCDAHSSNADSLAVGIQSGSDNMPL
jgi:hypothetical protein